MSKNSKDTSGLFVGLIVLFLIIGSIALVFTLTNGLTEDFKTFYLKYNNEMILSSNKEMAFEEGKAHKFTVKYLVNSKDTSYTVKFLPNEEVNFSYTVDGKTFNYKDIEDLSSYFVFTSDNDGFSFSIRPNCTLQNVLEVIHKTSNVVVPTIDLDSYFYVLQVSNYNDSVKYNIKFKTFVKSEINDSEDGSSDTIIPGNEVTVRFLVDGNVFSTSIYTVGSKLNEPIKEHISALYPGYIVNYWTCNGTKVDFNTFTVTEDVDIIAVSETGNTVTFKVAGNLYKQYIVKDGGSFTMPSTPVYPNSTFKGWSTDGGVSIANVVTSNITANITYDAVFDYSYDYTDWDNCPAGNYSNGFLINSWEDLMSTNYSINSGSLTSTNCATTEFIITPYGYDVGSISGTFVSNQNNLETIVWRGDYTGLDLKAFSSTSLKDVYILGCVTDIINYDYIIKDLTIHIYDFVDLSGDEEYLEALRNSPNLDFVNGLD